jgi:hypothetical protein
MFKSAARATTPADRPAEVDPLQDMLSGYVDNKVHEKKPIKYLCEGTGHGVCMLGEPTSQ